MDALGYPIAALITALGFILILTEALIPGGLFMIVGVTFFVTGIAGLLVPGLGTPLGLLVTMLVVAPIVYLTYSRLDLYGGDETGVRGTSDSSSLHGTYGRVVETVTETDGKVKLDNGGMNPHYMARSTEGPIEPDTEIVVTDPGGGNVIDVTPRDGTDDTQ